MKKFMSVALIVGTIAIATGCSSQKPAPAPAPQVQQPTQTSPTPNQTTPSTSATTTAGSGKDIYDKNCVACHGAGGAGGSAPALNSEKRTQAQVVDVTKKGKGSMPGYAATLSDTEIQAVSKYVSELKK
ncbi:MAG: c-type cytochrome [Bacillota bacterium]|nr:c-type cytochrome [Bacillota bacterium]MDP4158317.1 c-type cytochrome [Bacillota bacterium]